MMSNSRLRAAVCHFVVWGNLLLIAIDLMVFTRLSGRSRAGWPAERLPLGSQAPREVGRKLFRQRMQLAAKEQVDWKDKEVPTSLQSNGNVLREVARMLAKSQATQGFRREAASLSMKLWRIGHTGKEVTRLSVRSQLTPAPKGAIVRAGRRNDSVRRKAVRLSSGLKSDIGRESARVSVDEKSASRASSRPPATLQSVTAPVGPQNLSVVDVASEPPGRFPWILISGASAARPIKVFTYEESDLISRALAEFHHWEAPIVVRLLAFLAARPGLHFLDLGCNLGVYTLAVAARGRRVVAVDANRANLRRLALSVRDNGLGALVTLVHNAVDADYAVQYLRLVPRNVGGSETAASGPSKTRVAAVRADDLLRVAPFRRAVVKADIEGKEWRMLAGARRLFAEMDIPLVLMEWNAASRKATNGRFIIDFFRTRGYRPFATIDAGVALGADFARWPWDVVWRQEDGRSGQAGGSSHSAAPMST